MGIKRIFTADLFDLARSESGRFISAAKRGDLETVERMLKKGIDINTQDDSGYTALISAAHHNRSDVINHLIDKGARLDMQDKNGYTALLHAIMFDKTAVALILIEQGADINLGNKNDHNALMLAASNDNIRIINVLVKKGADLNAVNHEGNTALILAAGGNIAAAIKLIKNGANVNIANKSGRNALMRAAYKGMPEIAQVLVDAGADLHAVNEKGNQALSIAVSNRNTRTAAVIRKALQEKISKPPALKTATDKAAPAEPAAPAPAQSSESWQKIGAERISFTGIYPEDGIKLKEIYNFAAREKMVLVEELATGSKTPPVITSFNNIAQLNLEKALEKFTAQEGVADRDFVLHSTTMLKHKEPHKLD